MQNTSHLRVRFVLLVASSIVRYFSQLAGLAPKSYGRWAGSQHHIKPNCQIAWTDRFGGWTAVL